MPADAVPPSATHPPVRVLVAEDNDDLRRVLAVIVDAEPDLRCVGSVARPDEVLPAARESRPDVVVLDLLLDGGSSLHVIRELHAELPRAQVVMHSGYGSDITERETRRRGAAAFVVKTGDYDALLGAIRSAAQRARD